MEEPRPLRTTISLLAAVRVLERGREDVTMQKPEPPMDQAAQQQRGSPRNRALRLIFEYEERDVRLVSVQRVRMIPPPPQAVVPREGPAGSWVELRDQAGRALYRRVIGNPIVEDLEVVAEEPERPLQRVPVERPQGTFHLVVPDLAAAHTLALRAEPPTGRDAARAAAAPAADVLEFQLTVSSEEARNGNE